MGLVEHFAGNHEFLPPKKGAPADVQGCYGSLFTTRQFKVYKQMHTIPFGMSTIWGNHWLCVSMFLSPTFMHNRQLSNLRGAKNRVDLSHRCGAKKYCTHKEQRCLTSHSPLNLLHFVSPLWAYLCVPSPHLNWRVPWKHPPVSWSDWSFQYSHLIRPAGRVGHGLADDQHFDIRIVGRMFN